MPSPKRERNRPSKQVRAERQAAGRRRSAARRQRRVAFVSILLVVIIGVFGVLSAFNNPVDEDETATPTTGRQGQATCPKADGSSPRQIFFEQEPRRCIDATRTYEAVIQTTAGTVRAELYPSKAPRAVNNFVFLARYHFYDGLAFHKVLKDTFVQTGEPVAPGVTGPGYFFADDGLPLAGTDYVPGALVFAHDGPNQNGSQILVISGGQGATLPPVFPLFGQVTAGMDVIERINAGATADLNRPDPIYRVIGVTVTEIRSAA